MKTFVMSAVAATIAASSAMAFPVDTTVEWAGKTGATDFADQCEFTDNVNGEMSYDVSQNVWYTTKAATVVVSHTGANGVKVWADRFARELDGAALASGETSNAADGVAVPVAVSYSGQNYSGTSTQSQVLVLQQNGTNPGAIGNEWVDLATSLNGAAGSVVLREPTAVSGDYLPAPDGNQETLRVQYDGGAMLIAETDGALSNGTPGTFADGTLPNIMKLEIAGSAKPLDNVNMNSLMKNDTNYGITHNVICFQ